jgi:hypothetical protein
MPPCIVETINGRIQLSGETGESTVGLLVERDSLFAGTLLSRDQAHQLLEGLAAYLGAASSPADQPADR